MKDKTQILEMVAAGKITAEDAAKLLETLQGKNEAPIPPSPLKSTSSTAKNIRGKLKIEVNSSDGDNVNISLPLKIASIAGRFIPKEAKASLNENDIDLSELLKNIDDIIDEIDEDIVSVDSSDGDRVRIYIERN